MSIRLRLTLLYSVILALTLVAFSSVLYTAQYRYTLNIVENDLVASANRIVGMMTRPDRGQDRDWLAFWTVRQGGAGIGNTPPGNVLPNPQPPELDVRTRDTVRLLDTDGLPYDVPINENSEELTISQAGLKKLRSGESWIEIAHGEEGRVLTYDLPVKYNGEIIGIVQIGRSLVDRDRSLRALGTTLILGSLLTTAVAFGIGWLLSGFTLRPIHRITQTAHEIGQTRDFSSRVPYKGPNDELGRLATTFNGMLSRLADAYQQVTYSLQMQRDFVADVSHELRTPLTTIRGNLALLRREPPLPLVEQQDILNDLVGESERLIRLVTDLLTLARADAGRKLECERVAIKPILDEVCRQALLIEPGREIECAGPDDAITMVHPDAFKQVLLILVDNAIKHADGPVRVLMEIDDGQITIRVQDSGPGMSPELRERIFDRFYRGDVSRSTPGFGLGLSIAKALIEAQRGTLTVESQIGKGSTFIIRTPDMVDCSRDSQIVVK